MAYFSLNTWPFNVASRNPRALVPIAVGGYLLLVRALRYRRRDGWIRDYKKKYGSYDRDSLSQMTLDDAWPILRDMTSMEFPSIFSISVFFALFKTYGIPTISQLLLHTGQLASDTTASKRATDTGVLVSEFVMNGPDSARKFQGIARMNYLHARYRRAGKISDADMLYTLGLFALEPARWADARDWRPLTDLERCALGVFWRDMGEAMGIPYALLEPHLGPRRDGLDWLAAVDRWSVAYEENCMVPAESNEKVAWGTLDIIMFHTPVRFRGFMLKLVSAVLEDRLRTAMNIVEPSPVHRGIMSTYFTLRAWIIRYTHLPRFSWQKQEFFSEEPDPKTGKYYAMQYVSHPWYMKPTWSSRWGFEALRTRIYGGILPGDEGGKYHPDGYHIEEVGPEGMKGKGENEMKMIKSDLENRRMAQGGCPMGAVIKA
ncbi:hypothetical protein F5Y15DRAFT_425911 [Xylariaceae sp. FL0016]|nr:hypothetical protein F5Y15DRAFT_425911 [Xylariaceae sp. FL0016]